VIPVPVLARRRHEIGEPVEKLKRREVDDAIGARPNQGKTLTRDELSYIMGYTKNFSIEIRGDH